MQRWISSRMKTTKGLTKWVHPSASARISASRCDFHSTIPPRKKSHRKQSASRIVIPVCDWTRHKCFNTQTTNGSFRVHLRFNFLPINSLLCTKRGWDIWNVNFGQMQFKQKYFRRGNVGQPKLFSATLYLEAFRSSLRVQRVVALFEALKAEIAAFTLKNAN